MKKGDVIICIDDKNCFSVEGLLPNLTLHKAYVVYSETSTGLSEKVQRVFIVDDANQIFGYVKQRFITLRESRKLKMKKIISADRPI